MADGNKRRSQFQGTPDTPFESENRFDSGVAPEDAPKKATAAQMANRKIKGVSSLKARRPGISSGLSHTPQSNPFAQSTPAPSINPSTSFPPAGNAPASNPFGASANSSFPAFTPPTAPSFNFSTGASNPFANTSSGVNGTASSGFSGSIFNIPPSQPQQTNPFASQTNNTSSQQPQAQANSSSLFAQPQANNSSGFGQSQANNSNGFNFQSQPTASTTPQKPPPVNFFGSTTPFGKPPQAVQAQQSDDLMHTSPDAKAPQQQSSTNLFTGFGAPAPSPAAAPAPNFLSSAQPASEKPVAEKTVSDTSSTTQATPTAAPTMAGSSTPFSSAGGMFNFSKQTPAATNKAFGEASTPAQSTPNPFTGASTPSQTNNASAGIFGASTSNQTSGIFSPASTPKPTSNLFGQTSGSPAQNQGSALFSQPSVPSATKAPFSIFTPSSNPSGTSETSNIFAQSIGASTANQSSGGFNLPASTAAPDQRSEKTATTTAPAQASTLFGFKPTASSGPSQPSNAFGGSGSTQANDVFGGSSASGQTAEPPAAKPASSIFNSKPPSFGPLSPSTSAQNVQSKPTPAKPTSSDAPKPSATPFSKETQASRASDASTMPALTGNSPSQPVPNQFSFGGSTQSSGMGQPTIGQVSQQPTSQQVPHTSQPQPSSGFQGLVKVKPGVGTEDFTPGAPPAHLDQWQADMWRCATEVVELNEAFKMKINNAPTAADWTQLSAWHFERSNRLSKRMDAIRKDRAAAMGVTGRESALSTKRKATEAPAPVEQQNTETPSKKQRAAESSPTSNTASVFSSVLSKSTGSFPGNGPTQQAAPKFSASTTAASSSGGNGGGGFSFLGGASSNATPSKTMFGSSAAPAPGKDSASSGNDLSYPDLSSSMANQQQSTSAFGASTANQQQPASPFGSSANQPKTTFGGFGTPNANSTQSTSAFGSSDTNQAKTLFGTSGAAATPGKDNTSSQAQSFGGGSTPFSSIGTTTSTNATPSKSMFGTQATPASPKDTSSSQAFSGFTPSKTTESSQVSGFKPSTSGFKPSTSGFKPSTSGFTPSNTAPSGGFASQFADQSKKAAQKLMEKRKDEDWDEDEETEKQWEDRYWKEQKAKEAAEKESLKNAPGFKPSSSNVSSDAESSSKSASTSNAAKDSSKSQFVPTITVDSADLSGSGATSNGLVPSRTGSPGSVFDGPAPPLASSHNIFGHLSSSEQSGDQEEESEQEQDRADQGSRDEGSQGTENGSKTDTSKAISSSNASKQISAATDSEDETLEDAMRRKREKPAEATEAKKSLFDRISFDKKDTTESASTTSKAIEAPETPAKSDLFGFSGVTNNPSFNFGGSTTPTFNFGGSTTPSFKLGGTTTPDFKGDQTWKPDSPIKFGTSTGAGNSETLKSIPQTSVAAGPMAPFTFPAFSAPNSTAATSAQSSRAQTPATADEKTENEEEAEPQVSLYSDLTAEERAAFTTLFHVEKAHAKEYEAETPDKPDVKKWRSKALGPLWVLKNKENGKVLVRMRILPSGAMPVNFFILPKLKAEVKGKAVLVPFAKDGGLGRYYVAFGDKGGAEEFAGVVNGNLPE